MAAYGADYTGVRRISGIVLLRGTGFFMSEPCSLVAVT